MVLPHNPLERRTLMSTTILSFQNRVVIETLHSEGRSLRYIANYLGFSKTTIFNELHRLNSEYQAELAQTDFEQKVSQRGRKSSLTKNLKHLVEEKIQVQKWSIEQVAHVVGIAYKTVYNWIDQGWLDVQLPDLPDHGIRRHRAKEKRGTFSHGRSIEERSHKVETRQEFGHFEADTVQGKAHRGAVMTLVERQSKVMIVLNVHRKTDEAVNYHLDKWLSKMPRHFVKSITFDNGKEFAGWREIANKHDLHTYFAEVGAPNQRGLNENNNGILRRDGLSKRLDFRNLPDELITQLMHKRNTIPRKSLHYRTPLEVFLSHVTDEQLSTFF